MDDGAIDSIRYTFLVIFLGCACAASVIFYNDVSKRETYAGATTKAEGKPSKAPINTPPPSPPDATLKSDPGEHFTNYAEKFMVEFKKRSDVSVGNYSIDVNKTDSMVTPYVACIEVYYGKYNKIKFGFGSKKNRWDHRSTKVEDLLLNKWYDWTDSTPGATAHVIALGIINDGFSKEH